MRLNLTDFTHWPHTVLAEVLTPGDLAVDLTAGKGLDTLFLYEAVGAAGCVVGFDVQLEGLRKAETLLRDVGAYVRVWEDGAPDALEPGVHLIRSDHARWTEFVSIEPKAIIANLGYLPGSDKGVVTNGVSTLAALQSGLERLAPGGRLAVVCYVGHPGGRAEADGVEALLTGLSNSAFRVLRVGNPKTNDAPFLLVAEKIGSAQ